MLTTEETLSSILPAFHIRRSVKSHCGQSGPTSEHPNGKWNLIKKIFGQNSKEEYLSLP